VTIPHGRTARRLDWDLLPPVLRREIERRVGSRVVSADSAGAGFTPGFASVLTCADGSRHFVKAASRKAQRPFAETYGEEARRLRALPPGVPSTRLRWTHQDELWVVLGLEYVDGRNPSRPWHRDDLERCLDALEPFADCTPPPALALPALEDELAGCLTCWGPVAARSPDLPHLTEARALAEGFREAVAGEALVHTDVRDDNLMLAGGGALVCGWGWPARGAAWVDTVTLLVAAHGDGLDADGVLSRRRLTRDVPDGHVDALLALLAGFFLEQAAQPVPNSSPYLREHHRWYADATWSWLSQRRGWT
jgi:hypothetical protein